ncbi:MAG: hypothetical protein RI637_06030 [Acidimicrobiia bacterium]|nr:hypothetical protein [Acidimicrobiia bacterium]
MTKSHRRSLFLILIGFLIVLVPAALAQEEAPADEPGAVIDVPEPAVRVVPEAPIEVEPAWTFRYLVPTSLVIALLVVVGSIVAYFVKVVRTRYRLIQ